jgi:uncharacterized protein YndB with AHSA1/START domain
VSTATLEVTTPSDREIAMIRVFNAPRQLVFDCFTKPELLLRWGLGPREWTLTGCEIDLRVGGTYRYVMTRNTGEIMGMRGVYLEIVVPERIVQSEQFDQAWYDGENRITSTFVEANGKTTLTQTCLFDSKEIRDTVLKSGMEGGASISYDRLAEMLPTFPPKHHNPSVGAMNMAWAVGQVTDLSLFQPQPVSGAGSRPALRSSGPIWLDPESRACTVFSPTPSPAPYTSHSPAFDDSPAPDSAAPSSSASTPLAQSKNPFRGS